MVSMAINPLRDPRDKRLPRIAGPSGIVIFGVTGDLARKKLMPAIYDLANRGLLPPGFALVGFARRDWANEDFTKVVHDAVRQYARTPFSEEVWRHLAEGFRFVQGAFDDDDAFDNLAATLADLDRIRGTGGNHAFYFSIPPGAFPVVLKQLKRSGLCNPHAEEWRRVVIEKPFGNNLKTAIELNQLVNDVFPNQLYEPIWNNNYVDHVQITQAEDIGVGGRAGYYDGIGAARDVIQNHLLQLMALTAMEEPVAFDPKELRREKVKVLSAVQLPKDLSTGTARGQYAGGWQGGSKVLGYLEEEGISKSSTTETYAAVKLLVETRRWAGVPFYLRTGKRLGKRVSEIAVVFKRAPHLPFSHNDTEELGSNMLVIRVQPDEGVTIRFGSKVPGPAMEVRDVSMDFSYGQSFTEASPEAYERLILDVLLGEPSLFPQDEEVELSWKILDPIEKHWARSNTKVEQYLSGSWGPASADAMMARDGRAWRRP
jgi:glucose-6-phosphate 1-dehydrogenase